MSDKQFIWLNGQLKACDDLMIRFHKPDEKGKEKGELILFWDDYKKCARIPVGRIKGAVFTLPGKPLVYDLKL